MSFGAPRGLFGGRTATRLAEPSPTRVRTGFDIIGGEEPQTAEEPLFVEDDPNYIDVNDDEHAVLLESNPERQVIPPISLATRPTSPGRTQVTISPRGRAEVPPTTFAQRLASPSPSQRTAGTFVQRMASPSPSQRASNILVEFWAPDRDDGAGNEWVTGNASFYLRAPRSKRQQPLPLTFQPQKALAGPAIRQAVETQISRGPPTFGTPTPPASSQVLLASSGGTTPFPAATPIKPFVPPATTTPLGLTPAAPVSSSFMTGLLASSGGAVPLKAPAPASSSFMTGLLASSSGTVPPKAPVQSSFMTGLLAPSGGAVPPKVPVQSSMFATTAPAPGPSGTAPASSSFMTGLLASGGAIPPKAPAQSSMFATTAPNPFGAPASSSFMTPAPTPFGAPAQQPFFQSSSSGGTSVFPATGLTAPQTGRKPGRPRGGKAAVGRGAPAVPPASASMFAPGAPARQETGFGGFGQPSQQGSESDILGGRMAPMNVFGAAPVVPPSTAHQQQIDILMGGSIPTSGSGAGIPQQAFAPRPGGAF